MPINSHSGHRDLIILILLTGKVRPEHWAFLPEEADNISNPCFCNTEFELQRVNVRQPLLFVFYFSMLMSKTSITEKNWMHFFYNKENYTTWSFLSLKGKSLQLLRSSHVTCRLISPLPHYLLLQISSLSHHVGLLTVPWIKQTVPMLTLDIGYLFCLKASSIDLYDSIPYLLQVFAQFPLDNEDYLDWSCFRWPYSWYH